MPTRRTYRHIESAEQIAFRAWFEFTYKGVLFYAIPNGGYRNKATAVRLKKEGVKPGMPDICVPGWFLYIEMKQAECGDTSEEQDEIIDYLRGVGYTVFVCHGCNDAIEQVRRFVKWKCQIK